MISWQKEALRAGAGPEGCDVKGSDKVQQQFLGRAILTHLGLLSASPSPPQLEKSLGLQVTAQSELTRGPY